MKPHKAIEQDKTLYLELPVSLVMANIGTVKSFLLLVHWNILFSLMCSHPHSYAHGT